MLNETTTRCQRTEVQHREALQRALRRDLRHGALDEEGLCGPLRRRPVGRGSYMRETLEQFMAQWEARFREHNDEGWCFCERCLEADRDRVLHREAVNRSKDHWHDGSKHAHREQRWVIDRENGFLPVWTTPPLGRRFPEGSTLARPEGYRPYSVF